jgi:hypothetical protein
MSNFTYREISIASNFQIKLIFMINLLIIIFCFLIFNVHPHIIKIFSFNEQKNAFIR